MTQGEKIFSVLFALCIGTLVALESSILYGVVAALVSHCWWMLVFLTNNTKE